MPDDGDHIKELVRGGYRLVWPMAWPYCVLCGLPAIGVWTTRSMASALRDPFCRHCRENFPISCAGFIAWIGEMRAPDGLGHWISPTSIVIPT